MKSKNPIRAAGIAGLLSCATAAAEPPSSGLPLWEAGVGGGFLTTPAYPAAEKNSSRLLALPFLLYRGEILRSDQSGIGARVLRTDRVEFDIGLAASLPAHSEDVPARAGMPDLGTLLEFGPRIKLKLADRGERGRVRFELPLRAVLEARSGLRGQGWTLEPRLLFEQPEDGGWRWDAQIGAVIGSKRINRYFYEVQPQFATPSRPAYEAGSGLMLLRTGLSASRKLDPDVRVFGFVRYESYAGSANRHSPLYRESTGASAGFGFMWTLARSAARARE